MTIRLTLCERDATDRQSDRQTDRLTDRHTHHNTWYPYWGGEVLTCGTSIHFSAASMAFLALSTAFFGFIPGQSGHRPAAVYKYHESRPSCSTHARTIRATFWKVPRKILGKLLILGATDTQVATSSRGYSATVEHCTNRPINSVQRSTM